MSVKKGIAIEYSGDLPKILAIARGELYSKLLEIAKENGISIYEDPDLAEVLSELSPGCEIPEDLFKAVAEVLAFCYRVNQDFKHKIDKLNI